MSKLVACLLNVSEGRCFSTLENIANAAASSPPVTVLNIFADHDYNRSVITIAAPSENISSCVLASATQAFQSIRLDRQSGIHPRLGSVDLVPFYPLTETISVAECGEIAQDFGYRLISNVPGSSVFFFGEADSQKRGLVSRRKAVRWFGNGSTENADIGQFNASRGLTGVGASHYVTNFNISLATTDIEVGSSIADKIRASAPGGIPGIQVMAFPHNGEVEIACNVECCPNVTFPYDIASVPGLHEYSYVSPEFLEQRITDLASSYNVTVSGRRVVGFVPSEASQLAAKAIAEDDRHVWRRRCALGMM